MATANVSISFECADLAEAETLIQSWHVHDGCQVHASVTENLPQTPGMIEDGQLVSFEEITEAANAEALAAAEAEVGGPNVDSS